MVTQWMGAGRTRLLMAAMALVCAVSWSVEARAERRGIAVIIGNGEYRHRDIPPVDFAYRDAEAFKRYVIDVLGYAEENVIHVKDATRRQMLEVLGEPDAPMNDLQARLNMLGAGDAEVVVYYSGHGVPGGEKGRPYLLPVDVPPHAARREGYGIELLYGMLGRLKGAKSVWVFLDTCFSGSSHAGRLVTGSPVFSDAKLPELPEDVGEGMMVLTAVTATQIATWDKEARHGLFTNHLLEALYGKGDQDSDGKVTAGEVKSYLDRRMTAAAWLNERRPQQATLKGSGSEVLAAASAGGVFPKRPELGDGRTEDKKEKDVADTDPAPVEPEWDTETKRLIQLGLNALKFETGAADGIFGERTRGAIRKWQASKRFSVTGYLTMEHGAALKAMGEAAERKEAERRARLEREAEARRQAELERERREREAAERERVRLAREAEARRQAELERERRAREAAERRAREEKRPGRKFQDCAECPWMVVVPAGEYWMGSPEGEAGRDEDEGPRHRVRIGEVFAVGKYEVTRGEYGAFVRATGRNMSGGCLVWDVGAGKWKKEEGRSWVNAGYDQGEGHPVVCVSWADAKAYVAWLSEKTGKAYRLLSEAEWEYVARGGTETSRYWGDSEVGQCDHANGGDVTLKEEYGDWKWVTAPCRDGSIHTSEVGRYGENGYGLADMLGNVWEWVEDCWHESYGGAPEDGSAWVTGGNCDRRVLRGGSWVNEPWNLRSAIRSRDSAGFRGYGDGFRIARTLTP